MSDDLAIEVLHQALSLSEARWAVYLLTEAGFKLVAPRSKTQPKNFCDYGHPLKTWPCGERSCPTCKYDGVKRRRAAAKAALSPSP